MACEWDLDHDVFTLVEERSVAEARRNVNLGSCLDDELGTGRLSTRFVDSSADVLIAVFPC